MNEENLKKYPVIAKKKDKKTVSEAKNKTFDYLNKMH